ncbi:juvenile hormone epoxide hydrolase 1 [Scaptodrosophila lebanonensis]|uniref:Epoxide hydrolase n=1 Tax=Drosophila lebanonensis TaxID=7225 RepID=A0A6J2ULZ5_DROLE|nr:juvenile hormone epoxide hydrolase 1 [Scaptodrosophila lebanonensis]
MGTFVRILVAGLAIALAVAFKNYRDLSAPAPLPNLDNNAYWGPGEPKDYKANDAVVPYDIGVAPELIADLHAQLSRPLRLQEPLEGVGFEYGFNSKELRKVINYWRDSYLPKWSEREQYLKKFPHFQTTIQGLKIHFLHVKPQKVEGKKVLPLLLMHGWPGSVREFYELIPLLTTPSASSEYVFEVIAPSLPGYGWSQGSSKTGLGVAQVAVIMRNLMLRLHFDKFVIQGGDWGALIGSNVASLFPENVLAYHSNMCTNNSPVSNIKLILSSLFPGFFIDSQHAVFYKGIGSIFVHILEEFGYAHIQATKPDTIGSALAHNPVGLAAYILEKFSTWTNAEYKHLEDGGLSKRFTYDALLDNIMIYYVTNSITTSVRLYSESMNKAQLALNLDSVKVQAPTGCAHFLHELAHTPDSLLKDKFVNLIHTTHYTEGGHFPAFEIPEKLYTDFRNFVNKLEN